MDLVDRLMNQLQKEANKSWYLDENGRRQTSIPLLSPATELQPRWNPVF